MPRQLRSKSHQSGSDSTVETDGSREDTSHSILGGLRGGYRITGSEQRTDSNFVETFRVPYKDKEIICERWNADTQSQQRSGKDKSAKKRAVQLDPPALIFTHGAGGGLSNPATRHFVEGFSTISPVVAFQGTMNLQSRVSTFHEVVEAERKRMQEGSANDHKNDSGDHSRFGRTTALGGRSMGARAAVMTVLDETGAEQARPLVLVSYPLIGGKQGDVRDAILKDLSEDIDVLFVIGSKDASCDLKQLKKVRDEMSARTWLLVVEGADHSMGFGSKKVGVEEVRKKSGAITGEWLCAARDEEKKKCVIRWDGDEKKVVDDGWQSE